MSGFLSGKVVAITGSGGGIGRAVALAAAGEGARIVVADIGVSLDGGDPQSQVAEAVVAEIEAAGGEAVAVAESVTTLAGGEKIIGAGVEKWGRIDGAVAVAGILRERMLFNMAEDEWDAVIETHLKGHFTVFRAASAIMRKQEGGGSLVAFTSGAFAGSVAQANYASAKGGIVSLVRSAAAGLHRYGITANAVAPVARTRMSANVPMDLAEMGDPEDVAPLVVYLLSDKAKHVTGQVYTSVGPESGPSAPGGAGPPSRSPPDWTRQLGRSACPCSTSSRRTVRRPRRRPRLTRVPLSRVPLPGGYRPVGTEVSTSSMTLVDSLSRSPNDAAMYSRVSCCAASIRFSAPTANNRPRTGISHSDSARSMAITTGTKCSAVSNTTYRGSHSGSYLALNSQSDSIWAKLDSRLRNHRSARCMAPSPFSPASVERRVAKLRLSPLKFPA